MHPAAEQREPGDGPPGDEHVVGRHEPVQAGGLGVVGHRVGEWRPRVLERAHDERDRAGELDRNRIQPGQTRALLVVDVEAIDDVERVHRDLGGDGRQPEAEQDGELLPATVRAPEAMAHRPPEHEQHDRRDGVVTEQQSAGPVAAADDEDERHHDREQHVGDGGRRVHPEPFVDAEQRHRRTRGS